MAISRRLISMSTFAISKTAIKGKFFSTSGAIESEKTKITTLPNGFRVVSETSPDRIASIGLYVDSGSIYETEGSIGVSHLLKRMAFMSNLNLSRFRFEKKVAAIGGKVNSSSSREHMSYSCHALKTYAPEMVKLLIDSVRYPAFLEWEVHEQIQKVKEDISECFDCPQLLLLEAIHSTGYSGPYGNSIFASEASLDSLNSTVLEEFVTKNYTASRMVLAAFGVDHDKLLEYAEPLLSDLPKVSRQVELDASYRGGDFRREHSSGLTHFVLAFELAGGWVEKKDAIILTVLQMLMGGGGSLYPGGPGKAIYPRLYVRVLNEQEKIQYFSAFSNIYNRSALFGIQATTGSDFALDSISIAIKELIAVSTPGKVDTTQLNFAKELTKSEILLNFKSRTVALDDMGRNILTYGKRFSMDQILRAVEDVTAEDISKIAQKLLSSPLTMASSGDVCRLPSYESVCSMCNL